MNIGKSNLNVDNYFDSDDQVEFTIDNGTDYQITWLSRDEVKFLVEYLSGILE